MTEAPSRDEQQQVLRDELIALYPVLRRFAACAADSDLDPDDLVQEAFARVFRRADRMVPDQLGAYVRRSIVNLIANERRSRMRARDARRRSLDIAEGAEVSYPSHVVAILESASPMDRALVFLVDVEGFAVGDAAGVLELSHGAARARLSRARRRLQAALADAPHDPSGGDRHGS